MEVIGTGTGACTGASTCCSSLRVSFSFMHIRRNMDSFLSLLVLERDWCSTNEERAFVTEKFGNFKVKSIKKSKITTKCI